MSSVKQDKKGKQKSMAQKNKGTHAYQRPTGIATVAYIIIIESGTTAAI